MPSVEAPAKPEQKAGNFGKQPPVKPNETVSPTSEPTIVTTVSELEKVLADTERQRVIWVQLTRGDVSKESLESIQGWTKAGGVLWLDTDLARTFGFRLVKVPSGSLDGKAFVMDSTHPVIIGPEREDKEQRLDFGNSPFAGSRHREPRSLTSGASVTFTLSPSGLLLSGTLGEISRNATPLLGWSAGRVTNPPQLKAMKFWMCCAVRSYESGAVVYRPRKIHANGDAGEQFETNLRAWSFKVARPMAQDCEKTAESRTSGKKTIEGDSSEEQATH